MKNIVWTKYNCIYCEKAKAVLKSKGVPFEERVVGDGWTKADLLNMVPKAKTVPQIFLWGDYIGGYSDLENYIEEHGMSNG